MDEVTLYGLYISVHIYTFEIFYIYILYSYKLVAGFFLSNKLYYKPGQDSVFSFSVFRSKVFWHADRVNIEFPMFIFLSFDTTFQMFIHIYIYYVHIYYRVYFLSECASIFLDIGHT